MRLLECRIITVLVVEHAKMCAKLLQWCPILCDPMDCSLPGSSVYGILQARILSGLDALLQGIFPTLGLNLHLLCLLHWQAGSLPLTQLFSHSVMWLFVTPWTAAHQASLSFIISRSLLKLKSIESVMPFNHLILCHPLLLLPSIFPSINVFSNESALHIRWPRYYSFSFSISPSNECSGLISFRMDWFDLLTVQVLNTTVQKHQFFGTQLSLWSNSHIHTGLLEKPQLWLDRPFLAK